MNSVDKVRYIFEIYIEFCIQGANQNVGSQALLFIKLIVR